MNYLERGTISYLCSLVDSFRLPVCIFKGEIGKCLYVNSAFRTMVSQDGEFDWRSSKAFDWIHPDDVEDLRVFFQGLGSSNLRSGKNSKTFRLKENHQQISVEIFYLENDGIAAVFRGQVLVGNVEKEHLWKSLLSQITHDFNNVFQGISMSLELWVGKKSRSQENERLIHQAIAFSEKGKEIVEKVASIHHPKDVQESIDLIEVVREALRQWGKILPSQVSLRFFSEDENQLIQGNRRQIEQIAFNLFAVTFESLKGVGRLEVRVKGLRLFGAEASRIGLPLGEYVCLEVSASRREIFTIRNKILEPFLPLQSLRQQTDEEFNQLRSLVRDNCSGAIEMKSFDKGKSFHVYLPQTLRKSGSRNIRGKSPRGNETILLVENEEVLLNLEKNTLESLGYKVLACSNSETALDCFSCDSERFDLVVSDLTMPIIGGVELSQKVNRIKQTPVILITGSSTIPLGGKTFEGVKGLLRKPFTGADLGSLIRDVLDERLA